MTVDLIELHHPRARMDLSMPAAELIMEIGNYRQTQSLSRIFDEMISRTTIVALDEDEQVVGTAGLRIVRPGLGSIEDVISHPERRGEGIGSQVVKAAENLAIRKGVTELNLGSSLVAMSFYERLGYQRLDERTFRKFL